MKKILYILTIFLLNNYSLHSQCDNNVSTDYNSTPTNDALPSNANSQNYLNSFDWVPRDPATGNLDMYTTQGMNQGLLLPNGLINNIYSDQQASYYSYIFNDIEPTSENGWELIGVNLGYYPDGTPFASEFNDFPYIILYNKYSGILRVFGLLGPGFSVFDTSINAVVISLNFDDDFDFNGIFRLSEGYDRTLDQPTEINRMASVTQHPNANGRWFSADFQMAYDPCVCFYRSQIEFNFEFIQSQDITAQINAISIEEDLINGNLYNDQTDFLNNFAYIPTVDVEESTASNGYVIYKSMEKMVADYITQLEAYEATLDAVNAHNTKVKRNKWVLKGFELVLQTGLFVLTGPTGPAIKTGLQQFAPELLLPNDKLNPKIFTSEVNKALSKDITSFMGDNFFELEEQELPEKPSKPTATFTQMNMQGSIRRSTNITGPRIFSPGSYGGDYTNSSPEIQSPHSYPVYNDALGHFALLESPEIELYQDRRNTSCNYSEIPANDSSKVNLEFDYLQQFKLKNPLKYVINPVLDIKDYSIEVSLGVNTKTSRGDIQNSGMSLQDHTTNNIGLSANIESLMYDFYDEDQLAIYKEDQASGWIGGISELNIQMPNIPIDAIANITGSLGTKHEFEYRFIGDQNDGNAICNHYTDLQNGYLDLESYNHIYLDDNDFYLKIQLNIEYEQEINNGSEYLPNKKTYLFTYKIDPSNITVLNDPIDLNVVSSSYNIGQYPENLSLNGETFNGSQVDGCQLNGNTYLCKAWNDVELSGQFNVDSNYEVIIEAGNEVNVLPEAVTPPEMVWQIVPVLDYSNPMPPVDETYVSTFCNDNNAYQARMSNMPISNNNTADTTITNEIDNFAFNVFPNPTSGRTTASITLNEAGNGSLFITDVNGRKLGASFEDRPISAGESRHQLPTETLSSGMYLVHLFVDGVHHVKRIVKQ